jgi:hypothetical protein
VADEDEVEARQSRSNRTVPSTDGVWLRVGT